MTRQRENVLTALENWDLVKQYAETGANSAGTATEKYGIILESVEAKQAQLTAKVEEFKSNILSGGLIAGLTDVGKVLMDIVNAGDGLVGKVVLLTTAFIALSAVIKTLKTTALVANFVSLLKTIGSVIVGTVTLNGAFLNLGTSGIGALLFSIPKAIIGLIGLVAHFGLAEVSALGLKGALDLLNINPVMLAISALIAVVAGGVAVFNHFNVTLEEQHEKAREAQSAYEELANELQSVNDELKTTQQRINELEGKGNLTFAEEEELERLKLTNAELEKRQYWLEQEAKLKKEEATKEAKKAWEKDFNKDEYRSRYETYDTTAWGKTYTNYSMITENEYIKEQIRYYGELQKEIDDLVAKEGEWTEEEKTRYNTLKLQQESVNKYLTETGAKIQTDFLDAYDVDDKTKQSWLDLQNIIYETLNPETTENKLLKEIEKLPTAIQQNLKNGGLKDLKEAFTLNDVFNEKDYNAFVKVLESIGITADKATEYLNNMAKASKNITVTPLMSSADAIDAVKDKAELLAEAEIQMSENGYITADTVSELGAEFDNLDDYLIETADGYALTKSGLDALNGSMLKQYDIAVNEAYAGANNIINQEELKANGYDTTTMSIKEQLEAMKQLALASGVANSTKVQQKLTAEGFSGAMLSNHPEYQSAVDSMWGEVKAYDDALKNIENAEKNRDKVRNALQRVKKDTVDKANSSKKEWWEKELEKLKESLEADEITLDAYINGLEKLLGKVKKGSEAWRKITKELNEAKLDNVNNQFNRGEISIDQYISKLEELRKAYKKGTEGYKELTKTINDKKLERVNNQFEREEITIDQYISKLEELRKTYNKNTEDYKELTQTINDTKLDKVESQFERGEISIEQYIAKLEELRKVYNKNTDSYKELTQTINDTKLEQLDNQFDRGEITVTQYISKLTELRKAYKKGTEDYKELTQTINETKIDDLDSKFENKEISYSEYAKGLKEVRKSYSKLSEDYIEISTKITEANIENFQRQIDAIDQEINKLGEVNTDKEKVKYAEQLSKKYVTISKRIDALNKELKRTDMLAENRVIIEENVNELLEEQISLRDEIEDGVREYYENQRDYAEQQAELNRKQVLYNKEIELYGKKGKELFEWETNKKIKAIEDEIELRQSERDALDEINEKEELSNNLLEAKLKLQNALNNKTTKVLKRQADGSWQYEYSANMVDVKNAQKEVDDAKKALDDYNFEQNIKKLQDKADALQEGMDNLAEKYEEAEFYANREYEQTMNSIEKAYGDIDALVEKWMANNDDSTTKLTNSYKNLVKSNNSLENKMTDLTIALGGKYETVGDNGKIATFDTGGTIQGNGLALVHDKERVLTAQQNDYFEQLVSKLPTLLKLMDITKFNGYINNPINGFKGNNETAQTVISKVECVFPAITTPDGLQKAILELPRLALQKK